MVSGTLRTPKNTRRRVVGKVPDTFFNMQLANNVTEPKIRLVHQIT